MTAKCKLLLLGSIFISSIAVSQHVDEGYYNDWDYGPHGVYGNLRLFKIKDRTCYRIEKDGPQKVIVRQFNPSGIVINTISVSFVNGILSEVDRTDQWGEIYEYRNYQPKEENVFQVTDLVRGKNISLPCKYAIHIYSKELLTEVQNYSFTGQLMEDMNGVAIIQYKRYDDSIRFGERIETSFFDAQRRPVISAPAGYHKLVTRYDEHDNKISEFYLGINDEPVTIPNGVSGVRGSYDEDNNWIKIEFYDRNDKKTCSVGGFAADKREFQQGYLIKDTRLDSLGNPVKPLPSSDGVAIITYEYDTAGNRIREEYFDQLGKPTNSQSGVQEIASFFSAGNMRTRVSYFDAFGNPCVDRDGINTTLFIKDDRNRTVQESNYDVDGHPIKTHTEKVFMLKTKYDKYARVISTSYWADSSTRMPHWNGSYEITTKYDEDGQPIEYATLDANGQPFLAEDGSSVTKLMHNSDGRLGERHFLHDNKLVNRKRGVTSQYSIIKYGYDQNGKVNELTFWGSDRTPVNARVWIVDSIAVHRIVFIYRGNRIIGQEYYKIDASKPFQIVDCLKNDYIGLNGISTGRKNAN
jgi:hypothetical protein